MLEARAICHGFDTVAKQALDSHVFCGCGRMFESERKFNEEPKCASPGPKFGGSGEVGAPATSSESLEEIVNAASDWLTNAFECCKTAQLHMAQLDFEAGHTDTALEHLQGYLTACVEQARDTCEGCGQSLCQDDAMLSCSGCLVARFCSVDHQKVSSKKTSLGGNLWKGRHKDICGVLGLWRNVLRFEDHHIIPCFWAQSSYDRELLAFLEAGRVRRAHPNRESE
jgi:hypothetical protein